MPRAAPPPYQAGVLAAAPAVAEAGLGWPALTMVTEPPPPPARGKGRVLVVVCCWDMDAGVPAAAGGDWLLMVTALLPRGKGG